MEDDVHRFPLQNKCRNRYLNVKSLKAPALIKRVCPIYKKE